MRAGIDIGGTKTEAVALDDDGRIVERVRIPTGYGPELVVDSAVHALSTLATSVGLRVSGFESVGVGVPGTVDSSSGTVSHALNLGVPRLDLASAIAARIGTDVRVENDVNAAAVGAFHSLALGPQTSMAYLNLGTGLAAGLVLGGRLWRGARGAAGEIGHISIDPAGPLDRDGQPGGLEVVASGSGIERQWPGGIANALAAAEAGDPAALDVRRRLFEGVSAAVRILVLTVDVEHVVIGGGLSRLGDVLTRGVTGVIEGWGASAPFLDSLELASRIRSVDADIPVAALGAAHLGGIEWQKS
jgi:predicted NBD/HSP70 family sugar kinase